MQVERKQNGNNFLQCFSEVIYSERTTPTQTSDHVSTTEVFIRKKNFRSKQANKQGICPTQAA